MAALLWSYDPSLTREEVRSYLHSTARDLGTPGTDIYFGAGRLDAAAALDDEHFKAVEEDNRRNLEDAHTEALAMNEHDDGDGFQRTPPIVTDQQVIDAVADTLGMTIAEAIERIAAIDINNMRMMVLAS